ncbi:MAG: hypothetical protein ACYSR0_08160 [Planctomycetota bacterium]|jgi:hypothetical protein
MLRNLAIYLIAIAFFLCNLFFFVNISVAVDDSTRDDYYSYEYGRLVASEEAETEEHKKDETPAKGEETTGKMNVYYCGCYGDEWKQPVGEPVYESCPICAMDTKSTGCGNFLKAK